MRRKINVTCLYNENRGKNRNIDYRKSIDIDYKSITSIQELPYFDSKVCETAYVT